MAYSSHDSPAVHYLAIGLLALAVVLHYGWSLAPPDAQALVWNISGAVVRLALLFAAVAHFRWSRLLVLVLCFWAAEEGMVIACNAAYIVSPWPVPAGQAMCSSLLHFDLGKIGAVVIALLVLAVSIRKSYR